MKAEKGSPYNFFMLPQQYRLPAQVRLRHSITYRTPLFTLKLAQNNLSYNRFGFIVRKTIDKRAVVRNRIRRVFRSCIEEMLGQINNGYDMLFLFEKGIIEKSRESMSLELHSLFTQKKLLK